MATWEDLANQYPALADQISQARATGVGTADQADAAISKMVAQRRQEYIKKGHAPNLAALNTLRDFGGISNDQIAAGKAVTDNNTFLGPAPFDLNQGYAAAAKPDTVTGALRQQAALGKPGPRRDTSALIDAAQKTTPAGNDLRNQLLSSETGASKFNRVAQPAADAIMKAYVANRRKDLALRFDMKNPVDRAYYNTYLVDGAMTAQNLLLGYAGDPNDLVDRGYITDKELQDYAQQTAGESKLRTIARGVGTQMVPQTLEFMAGGPADEALGGLAGVGGKVAGGALLGAGMYAPDPGSRFANTMTGAGLVGGAHALGALPGSFMDALPQTTDAAALRQLAGVPDMPRGPVGDAAGQSVRTPAVPTVPTADDVAKLFNFDADAKLAARRNKLRARMGQANPIDAGLAGESPVESTDAMKADVPGYSGLKGDDAASEPPSSAKTSDLGGGLNPANTDAGEEFLAARKALQVLVDARKLKPHEADTIAQAWVDAGNWRHWKPDPMPDTYGPGEERALAKRVAAPDPRTGRTLFPDQVRSMQGLGPEVPDLAMKQPTRLTPDTTGNTQIVKSRALELPDLPRLRNERGSADINGLLDAAKKGGKGLAKAVRSWVEVNHGLTKDITKEPLQAFERDKNIATNHMERDLGELAAARVPADIQNRVVSSRALKGDLDLSRLAKYPKVQKMISKISMAIDTESAKYGAWLQAHGMNSAGIKDALGQWLHRTYSRLEPTDAVVAKNVRLFQRSRAFELPNGQVVPEGHGFLWRTVKDANGNIVEGAKNLGRRVTADEATNFAKDLLARKEDNYMPAIDRKGVGGTSIAKARTQMMNDPRIRMLRGEQKGLGVFVHSLEQIRMLNAKHQFIDSIMATEPKWDTWYPDRKPSSGDWVEMPQLKHLGNMAGKQVPKPIAELLVQHFGGLTGAGPDEVLFGGNSVTGQFNKLFNWWKFKNTVLNPGSILKQAAQNFVNLVGSANSPMWPGNWKAHNMARRLLTTADAAKLADIPLTPEGAPILDQAAGLLGAASRAEFTGSLQRALDAGMDRADINPLSAYKKLTAAVDKGKIKAESVYNFFDQHAKLSTYIKARGLDGGSGIQVTDLSPHKILSHDDAVAYVNDMFINYQRPSKLVQWVRLHPWSQAILNPFLSYKVLNVPVLARAIARHPLRMGAMLATLYGVKNLAWSGQDADQIRRGIPDDKSFPMKWNIALPHDYPATVDAGGLFPGAELGELASTFKWLPKYSPDKGFSTFAGPNYDATEGLGGNAYIAAHAFLLHNYLNGPLVQAIGSEDREPGESLTEKLGEGLLQQTFPWANNYKDAKELYLAIDGAPSMPGTAPRSKLLSTMNLLGARTQTIDAKSMMQKYNTLNSGGFTQKDLKAARMPIMMKLAAHEITPKEALDQLMRINAHEGQIAQKVGQ